MPKGTKVSRCVDKVKKSKDEGAAIAICQDSTKQGYATGKKLKEAIAAKVVKPGAGKKAKKLGDEHDDKWEDEETKKGYWTPAADDTTGYASKTSDNASDDFQHGGWKKETKGKKGKKPMKTKNEETDEAAADKAAKEESKKKPKKPEAPDAVEKAMGKAQKGHPGGVQHFRDKIMKAGKAAVKKHDEKLAGESRVHTYKSLANILVEKEWTTGFQDPDHKPKPVKPIAHGSKAIEAARKDLPQNVKDAAKKKVAAEEAARLKKQQNSHTEYKRMGLYLAEALGYRVDEILPVLAAGAARIGAVAGRAAAAGAKALGKVGSKVGTKVAGMAKKKAVGMAKEKLAGRVQAGPEGVATGDDTAKKGAELGQQAKSNKDLEEGKIMNSYVKKLMEYQVRPTAKRIEKESPGGEGSRMSDQGDKPISRDSLVDREAKKAQTKVDTKLKTKTNLKVSDAVQLSMDARRRAAKAGKSVEGSPPLPRETKKDAAADAAQDKKRREAPGDK